MINRKPFKLFIFDADGCLRKCTVEGQVCPNKPSEWVLRDGVKEWFRENIESRDVYWGIASNQMGVSIGYIKHHQAMGLLRDLADALGGTHSDAIMMCPDESVFYRKPGPGMLLAIMEFYKTSPEDTVFIGDMPSDREAANNAGVSFIHADELFGEDS